MVKRFEKFSLNFSISFFVIPCQSSLSNDRNNPTQHIATLLGATYCVRLATVLPHVARCWVLLAQIWPFSNLSQQHPTCRNTSQHGGQTYATCCAKQCCDMLRWHVAIVWPGILVPLWFIITSLVFFYLCKLLFSGFFHFKGNPGRGQNN